MKPINVYALTRELNSADLARLERQISDREQFLKVRQWEIDSLKCFVRQLEARMPDAFLLSFFYSFQIPKLGKEFDLLRLDEETVVNIELKSEPVSDDAVRRQLIQNRYYLALLGRNIRSYTYIASQNRLLRLTRSGNLTGADWETLITDLNGMGTCFDGEIESLFRTEQYIISPLREADRFLQQDYFLTSQQRDIERTVLKTIRELSNSYFGISGLPGTGKSLLLYDLAMRLSEKQKVCILHCGVFTKELERFNERLRRVDFIPAGRVKMLWESEEYTAVLADEAHRMPEAVFADLMRYAKTQAVPVIFSYDTEEMISDEETDKSVTARIESLEAFHAFRLTNRLRTNGALSYFYRYALHFSGSARQADCAGISVVSAADAAEAEKLIRYYLAEGYTWLRDPRICPEADRQTGSTNISAVAFGSFEKVLVLLDRSFYYDEQGFLRSSLPLSDADSPVRSLFYAMSRAKEKLAAVVVRNEAVLNVLLTIVQGRHPL